MGALGGSASRLCRLSAIALLLGGAARAAARPANCYAPSRCAFKGRGFDVYDYSGLCNETAYAATQANAPPSAQAAFFFNLCGDVSFACAPQGAPPALSRGAAIEFFDTSCFTDPRPPCPPPGSLCPDVSAGGALVPCTSACEVTAAAGAAAPPVVTATATGLHFAWPPVPAAAGDVYACPIDPASGEPFPRVLRADVTCDQTESGLAIDALTEPAVCVFELAARSAQACAQQGPHIPPACLDAWACTYFAIGDDGAQTAWDLRPLCTGGAGYNVTMSDTGNNTFAFEICGNAPVACAPRLYAPAATRGAAAQFIDSCPPFAPGNAECPLPGEQCNDTTAGPGFTTQCSGNCELLARAEWGPAFAPIVGSVQSILPGAVGINLTYAPVPATAADPFNGCAEDPLTGFPALRQWRVTLLCDPTVETGLAGLVVTEDPPCYYTLQARTKAACGSVVPPGEA